MKSNNITVNENTDGKGTIAETFPETGLNNGFVTIYSAFFANMNFNIGKTDADSLGLNIDEKRLLVILHEIGHITKQFSHGGLIRLPAMEILNRGKTWENVSLQGKFDVHSLYSSYSSNENKCWIGVWAGGGLYFTEDGGENWQQILDNKVSLNLGISSISFVDEKVGWIAGREFVSNVDSPERNTGILLKTQDGGKNWSKVETKLGEEEFRKVKFTDGKNGWLVGKKTIYQTIDGGGSWQKFFHLD